MNLEEFVIIILIVLTIVFAAYGLMSKDGPKYAAVLLSALSILAAIAIYVMGSGDSGEKEGETPPKYTSEEQVQVEPAVPESTEEVQIDDYQLPDKPLSPYGKALKENLEGKKTYSNAKKMDVILDTYDAREDKNGEDKPWYYSVDAYDGISKYNMTVYFADDMPFFVNLIKNGEGVVKLYYWGDELLMCYDKRGSDRVERYEDSEGFDALAEEFANIYEIACKLKKN